MRQCRKEPLAIQKSPFAVQEPVLFIAPEKHPALCCRIGSLSSPFTATALILDEVLGIKDLRSDKRIDFVGGIRGLGELKKRVDSGEMKVALALYPVSMKQLMDIADTGNIMPPKTTWFEPKLRSGLVIHKLD